MPRVGSAAKKKTKGRRSTDGRGRWHRARAAALPTPQAPAAHTLANRGSIPETLQSIWSLSVKELPLVIQQAGRTENVPFQHKVIDLCL